MLSRQWSRLSKIWKVVVYKQWLLFIKKQFPLSAFLRDDSYGVDFLLCKVLNMESSNPNADLEQLEVLIDNSLKDIDDNTLYEIFSMEFLAITPEITYLSPLNNFFNLKIIDFHCQNESRKIDFEILRKNNIVYVLDYADYKIIDFDRYSNIRKINNVIYIKGYGFPFEVHSVYRKLSAKYKIYE